MKTWISALLCLVMLVQNIQVTVLASENHEEESMEVSQCCCTEKCFEETPGCNVCDFDVTACIGSKQEKNTTYNADLTGVCGENLTWTLSEEGTLKISGTGAMEDYTSSSLVPWYSVRSQITSIMIANGVTSIGQNAFSYCTSLTNISIPNSVISIGKSAFDGCYALTDITIPNSVTSIGDFAFYACTSLTDVTIPKSVTSIGIEAFTEGHSLTGIWVEEGNSAFSSDSKGVLFDKDKTKLIQAPGKIAGSYTIPDSVTDLGAFAFCNCVDLTSVIIPNSVTNIGSSALSGCTNLTEVTIPDSVTNIGSYAFQRSTGLTNVIIGDGVINIDDGAFYECSGLTGMTIPDSVTTIGDDTFGYCTSLTGITIGNSVASIGFRAFYKCISLSELYFKGNAPSINNYAFDSVHATAYYPIDDPSWISEVMQHYGGTITWVADDSHSGTVPGDLTQDGIVTNKDVEYLLWHTLFPEEYPLETNADFTGDGSVDNKDVEYLLWHTLFPENYPLQAV